MTDLKPKDWDYDDHGHDPVILGILLVAAIGAFFLVIFLASPHAAHAAIAPGRPYVEKFLSTEDDGTPSVIHDDTDEEDAPMLPPTHVPGLRGEQHCTPTGDYTFECVPKEEWDLERRVQERENERAILKLEQEDDESSNP